MKSISVLILKILLWNSRIERVDNKKEKKKIKNSKMKEVMERGFDPIPWENQRPRKDKHRSPTKEEEDLRRTRR